MAKRRAGVLQLSSECGRARDDWAARWRPLKPRIREGRRALRSWVSTWAARYCGTRLPGGEPLPGPPASILVCRVNKRLGNVLFLTPMIRTLADAFPDADIDVLVRDPAHGRLLAGLPGVREIRHVPAGLAAVMQFAWRFRKRRYDLAIDPSVNATNNRLAMTLCRARFKLGFAGPEQWVRLTHAAPIPSDERHQARQAVRLLRDGIPGTRITAFDHLEIRPGGEARAAARELLSSAMGGATHGPIVGFFTGATGEKRFPWQWWREWVEAIQYSRNPPRLLRIVPPGTESGELPHVGVVAVDDLDRLGALIGRLDLFVCADSGPMHLAAAAGTPTIGLFRATSPQDYAPLGPRCIALGPGDTPAWSIAESTLEHLRLVQAASAGRPRQTARTLAAVC